MEKTYSLALHIFRRDLRLHDNTALLAALKSSALVIPCFIFDKRQIENNPYKSTHCLQFMTESLRALDKELKANNSRLYFFYGTPEDIIPQLLTELNIAAIFVNRDYTPFSRARDDHIEKICRETNIDFHQYADALLHEPEEIRKQNAQPYTIFTPFFNKASQLHVEPPKRNTLKNYYQKAITYEDSHTLKKLSQKKQLPLFVQGGRSEALVLLKNIKNLSDYETLRNFPARPGTTQLSAHHKFGTLSIRESYAEIIKQFGKSHTLIKELYWRDFFTHIAFHFPDVFGKAFHAKYNAIPWRNDTLKFQAWCEGKTGFPIIDAGMRELNTTGYMHNRVRMIVASFLVKDLHIDWRWGEKYFSQQLIDYDPAVNNGNWQWAASTGCDAQPYFRIFNPTLQQKKYDPACLYIKTWLPELAAIPANLIHKYETVAQAGYPRPIVNHATMAQIAKSFYKNIGH